MARIMVVDDHEEICRGLVKLLKLGGHQAWCAFSGEEALGHVQQEPPDLMILDIMMPGMDGMEVLRRLRSDPRTSHLPVIIFSALSDPSYVNHALAKGATDYWVKASFDYSQLQTRIRDHLPGQQQN